MIILGHRGSTTKDIHENTVEAFQLAKDLGANGIQTDIRISKDNEMVLFRDNSIDGEWIHDLTLDEINQHAGYKVATLSDLLKWSSKEFILNLEIKQHNIVGEVINELKEFKDREYIISSFHHPTAFKISKAISAPAGLLMPVRPVYIKPFLQLIPAALEYIIWDYDVYSPDIKIELLQYKHLVYNMNSTKIKKKDILDGIISDNLDAHVKNGKN